MHKVVAPELEGRILDELDEGDEEPPGVRPVHDQPLQQNPAGGSGETRVTLGTTTMRFGAAHAGERCERRRPTW